MYSKIASNFMCMSALSAYMHMYHIHTWYPWWAEEGADCEPQSGCWELNQLRQWVMGTESWSSSRVTSVLEH